MRKFQSIKLKNKSAFGICFFSALYIVLVTLIPIVGFGSKGTQTNTIVKAGIFITFLLIVLFQSKFRVSFKFGNVVVLFSYLITQVINIVTDNYSVSVIDVLIQLAVIIALLFFLPNVSAKKLDILTGIKALLLFDFIAIIYNFFLHISRFAQLSFLTNVYYDMHSFFENKNTYGMILFVALVMMFYWYYLVDQEDQKSKKRITVLICLQLFAIAVSMCRTALLCTAIFLILNYLKHFNARKLIGTILLLIVGVAVFCIPSVKQYVLYVLLRVDVDTFREPIVNASLEIVSENFWFGCGEGSWQPILYDISGRVYSHNGFLSVLMTGGIVFFVGYLVILGKSLNWAIKVLKADFSLGCQFVFFLISIVVYAFFEPIVLLEANASNFAFTTAAVIIPQMYCNVLQQNNSEPGVIAQ